MAMKHIIRLLCFLCCQILATQGIAQLYFQATATISGNSILYKIKPVNGNITCGWSDIEFFFRNSTTSPVADNEFMNATIDVNTVDFPGVSIPYNGMNIQGTETNTNTYWFGVSFTGTTPKTYNQNQEYLVCTITLSSSPSAFAFQLCHNEPYYNPHYIVLTDRNGGDQTNLTGTNKYYGPGATICEPNNCPNSTSGNNHILPLNGAAPVELVDFQAIKYGPHTARLEWRTAVEVNFEAFGIEWLNGNSWEQIGWVKARGVDGGGASYTFYDQAVSDPIAYYRLKMLDLDGTFVYSPVRTVSFDGDKSLRIFPNPASNEIYIQFGADVAEEDIRIELFDWSGRIVLQQKITTAPGATQSVSLQEYALPDGTYLFRASAGNGPAFVQRLMVEHEF